MNKTRSFFRVYLILSLLFMLVSWHSYNPLDIIHLKSNTPKQKFFDEAHKGIDIEVLLYTKEDCEKYLSKDLLKKGFQPIQVIIHNNTANTYSICPSSIDMKTATAKEVITKIKIGTIPKKVGYSVAGFFLWPVSVFSTIESLVHAKSLKQLESGINAKLVRDGVIEPYTTTARIILVQKEELKKEFDIHLIDLGTLDPYTHHFSG